ncbi:MAG: laminin B domain-containing protein [Armatimonadota bacterium]
MARVLKVVSAAALFVLLSASMAQCSVLASSTFDNDNDGWKITGDAQQGSSAPYWAASGGNPGGFIYATDDVQGGVWYWSAPGKFLGNMSAAYGYTLDFDLMQTPTDTQFEADDVIITGGGLTMKLNTSYNPGNKWTHYSVNLAQGAGWTVNGAAAASSSINTVLSSVTSIWIRGEYRTGSDTGSLDNVKLSGAVPEPGSLAGLASGLGALMMGFIRRRK